MSQPTAAVPLPPLPSDRPVRVLFVCLGNICRSPMAEAVFRHRAEQAGVADAFEIDSVGTGSWHVGNPADPRTLRVLQNHGIPHDGRARQLAAADFDRFDLLLTMDASNRENALRLARHPEQAAKVLLFRSLDPAGTGDVPDPYWAGESETEGFEAVYQMVDRTCAAWLERLIAAR